MYKTLSKSKNSFSPQSTSKYRHNCTHISKLTTTPDTLNSSDIKAVIKFTVVKSDNSFILKRDDNTTTTFKLCKPRTKITMAEFKRISNISYCIHSNGQLSFRCYSSWCHFTVKSKEKYLNHIREYHRNEKGLKFFCHSCHTRLAIRNIEDEFSHMENIHLEKLSALAMDEKFLREIKVEKLSENEVRDSFDSGIDMDVVRNMKKEKDDESHHNNGSSSSEILKNIEKEKTPQEISHKRDSEHNLKNIKHEKDLEVTREMIYDVREVDNCLEKSKQNFLGSKKSTDDAQKFRHNTENAQNIRHDTDNTKSLKSDSGKAQKVNPSSEFNHNFKAGARNTEQIVNSIQNTTFHKPNIENTQTLSQDNSKVDKIILKRKNDRPTGFPSKKFRPASLKIATIESVNPQKTQTSSHSETSPDSASNCSKMSIEKTKFASETNKKEFSTQKTLVQSNDSNCPNKYSYQTYKCQSKTNLKQSNDCEASNDNSTGFCSTYNSKDFNSHKSGSAAYQKLDKSTPCRSDNSTLNKINNSIQSKLSSSRPNQANGPKTHNSVSLESEKSVLNKSISPLPHKLKLNNSPQNSSAKILTSPNTAQKSPLKSTKNPPTSPRTPQPSTSRQNLNHSPYDIPYQTEAAKNLRVLSGLDLMRWETDQRRLRSNKKYEIVYKNMLDKYSLVALYKCMGKKCSYTTDSMQTMSKHLYHHVHSSNLAKEAIKKIFNKKIEEAKTYDEKKELKSMFNEKLTDATDYHMLCPYCPLKELVHHSRISRFLHHINDVHRKDIYQCGRCFFRTCVKEVCHEHSLKSHPRKEVILYECDGKDRLKIVKTQNNERLKKKRKEFVTPLMCKICNIGFYPLREFLSHCENYHQSEQGQVERQLAVLDEAFKLQVYGLLQCLYCCHGALDESKMLTHLIEHPSEMAFYCLREPDRHSTDPNYYQKVESVAIKEITARNIKVIEFKDEEKSFLEKKNFKKLVDSQLEETIEGD